MRSASFFKFLFGCLRCPAAALCILFSLVSGFFAAEAVAVETAAPPIRSAAEIDYPPFSIVDEQGKASGFSVELLRAALSTMGRDVTFKTGPWAEVRGWLEKGEIDALPLVGRTPEREPLFDFTFPYMTLHGAIVVRKDAADIWDLADLTGRTVAVMKGDNAEEFLRREDRGIDIRTTATFEEALRELSQGRHDAVFIQRLVALRLIQESGLTNLKVVNNPIAEFRQDFCFAVKDGDRETLALLNEGLSIVMADGTYRHLHAKWFASLDLSAHRRIVVGGDHNFPPFEYLDENGRPAGYNVDLTRAIAREVGLDIEIRLGPWAKIREYLARGEIDVIQGMFYSPQRDLAFDFTPSHSVNHCVAVVRKGEGPPPTTIEALAQKRIVVQDGDIMHDVAVDNGLETVSAVDAQEDALKELAQGKHDVALVSRMTALYWIKQYGWENLVVGKKPFFSHEYCYAVPNNQKALLAQFSEGLNILEDTGEYRRIQEKWFGVYEDLPPTLAEVMRHVALIAGPLLLLLFGFFLWSWSLRKQVAARTEAVRKSEEFQRAMVECSPVAIYSVDFGGRVMAWNSSAERIFGWSEKEVAGKPLPIVPEDRRAEFDAIRKQIMAGQIFVGREVVRKKKDGTTFLGSLSAAPIHDAAGRMTGIIAAMEDITERKKAEAEHERLQDQLLQAQKMESVGRLAGGVAHDYNNMLGVILGYTELALERVEPEDPLHEDLTEILAAAKRSSDITRQLLAFASKQTIDPKVLDLNETVESMLKMLRRLIGENIDLSWQPGGGLWPVRMDPSQLDQILANLCVNAGDAIAEVGNITIETENVAIDEEYCAAHAGFVPGEFVVLAVSDDGTGMDKEVLENLFEPFFTTKKSGKGTGLGLATVYGIVKQNRGFINVYSEPGKGTTFRIYLPRHTGDNEEEKKPIVQEVAAGRGETILLVEDERSILRIGKKMLESLGYSVLAAASAEEAAALAKEHTDEIHLLITDVVMPAMNGRELAERLQALYPDLKVLFMSGYTADVIAHQGVLDDGVCFMQKPFSKQELAAKVREALRG